MIPENILSKYNPTLKTYKVGQLIFEEGTNAKFFYQIKKGKVKVFNLSEDGKEVLHAYFKDGDSFGAPALIANFKRPARAETIEKSSIYTLSRELFMQILAKNSDIHLELTAKICQRLHFKSLLIKEVSLYPPEHRIITLLNHLKEKSNYQKKYEVQLTRQEISNLTGLRVETVIKAVKKLEKRNLLTLTNRKIYI
ncbi:Crp/Fnr family transcriptional regulator [Aureibaculum marinum]|uniref:Crp/Fnr family transcriptional regulator n=1 Tax=Aureibaculum marinum TaxID=2487930 RepID=A0A3N4NVM8_9FLAO|nr:Crp/Fnr family transcriptional regulator [Aureibaculum marinum]RPD98757.1 Crp/Fnr family transcriptional regulator [Aureibaculum marinum]